MNRVDINVSTGYVIWIINRLDINVVRALKVVLWISKALIINW